VTDTKTENIIPQVTKQNIVGLQNKANWAEEPDNFSCLYVMDCKVQTQEGWHSPLCL